MNITAIDPSTGKEVTQEIEMLSTNFLNFIVDNEFTDKQIENLISRLNISADAKQLLLSFSKATITAGKIVIKLGRKIIDLAMSIYKSFPKTSFGFILGIMLSVLISAIPIIGPIISILVGPILVVLGVALGGYQDLTDDNLKVRMDQLLKIVSKF